MFGGNWGGDDGVKMFGDNGTIKNMIFKKYDEDGNVLVDDMSFGNKVMQVLGMASVAYTLGTTSAKVNFNDSAMGFTRLA